MLHIRPKTSEFLLVSEIGFCVALGIVLFSFIAPGILIFTFRSSNPAVGVAIVIATFLFYSLALLVPALIFAEKRGWKAGIRVIGSEMVWLIVFALVFASLGF